MMHTLISLATYIISLACLIITTGCETSPISCTIPERLTPTGNISVHDPAVIKQGDTYYLFCTGGDRRGNIIPIRTSKDMIHWQRAGSVFDRLPDWVQTVVPQANGSWAPDISYFNDEYHLYYSVSTFGKNISAIGLATNVTLDIESPDYKWIDHGLVVKSGDRNDNFNAIDANLVYENANSVWLCWGSFWGGIMMREIDSETGMFKASNPTMYNLCARPRNSEHVSPPVEGAVEAPFIVKHGKWWYLFVSADFCCRGVDSNYNVIVGRSDRITGPYLDKNGVDMRNGGGTEILQAATENWRGVGHQAIYSENGTDYIFCHAYNGRNGRPSLQISTICWLEGWPITAPMP